MLSSPGRPLDNSCARYPMCPRPHLPMTRPNVFKMSRSWWSIRTGISKSRAACTTATPRSVTNFTASSLNFRLKHSSLHGNLDTVGNLILVSTKPAAGQNSSRDEFQLCGTSSDRTGWSRPRCSLRGRSGARHPRHARAKVRCAWLRVAALLQTPSLRAAARLRQVGTGSRLANRTGKRSEIAAYGRSSTLTDQDADDHHRWRRYWIRLPPDHPETADGAYGGASTCGTIAAIAARPLPSRQPVADAIGRADEADLVDRR